MIDGPLSKKVIKQGESIAILLFIAIPMSCHRLEQPMVTNIQNGIRISS